MWARTGIKSSNPLGLKYLTTRHQKLKQIATKNTRVSQARHAAIATRFINETGKFVSKLNSKHYLPCLYSCSICAWTCAGGVHTGDGSPPLVVGVAKRQIGSEKQSGGLLEPICDRAVARIGGIETPETFASFGYKRRYNLGRSKVHTKKRTGIPPVPKWDRKNCFRIGEGNRRVTRRRTHVRRVVRLR